MLHLLPATPKSSLASSDPVQPTVLQQPDLATILQQYSTLQAATGLATNENAKNLLGLDRTGLEQSTALLQFHILQQLQKTQQNYNENQVGSNSMHGGLIFVSERTNCRKSKLECILSGYFYR